MKKCLLPFIALIALLVASSAAPQARADVKLPKVIGSHMVLQRDRPLPIWGWADAGEEVTVKFDEATATAKADAQGNWKIVLPAVKADGKVHNIGDIHPRNKSDVGNRLALWALAKEYGKKDVVYSGPLYKSMKVEGSKIQLTFAQIGGGLKSRDGKPLTEFEIAAADGKFVAANAVIKGDTVVVEAKEVPSPTQVRFGWQNTANPNLINKEGLPASPFQTNNWQGGTGE